MIVQVSVRSKIPRSEFFPKDCQSRHQTDLRSLVQYNLLWNTQEHTASRTFSRAAAPTPDSSAARRLREGSVPSRRSTAHRLTSMETKASIRRSSKLKESGSSRIAGGERKIREMIRIVNRIAQNSMIDLIK